MTTPQQVLAAQGLVERADERVGAFASAQRWFGQRGQPLRGMSIADAGVLREAEPSVLFVAVAVDYEGGKRDLYHVPIGVRRGTVADVLDAAWVVAEGERDGAPVVFVDALADPDCAIALWEVMAQGVRRPTVHGELRAGWRLPRSVEDLGGSLRPLGREQSNTSLVRGDSEVLKCFRRIDDGITPELEMTETLSNAGFAAVARPLGAIEYLRPGVETAVVALLQPYLHNGTEGWALAITSLRDLYASVEDAVEPSSEDAQRAVETQGATFLPEATRLGEVTAEMHLVLSSDTLPAAVGPKLVTAETLNGWADEMTADLDRLLQRENAVLDPLRSLRGQVTAIFDAIRGLGDGGLAIRVHGDLHLGQVLRTDAGWTIVDFEGEPSRPLAERRQRSSPLRDVAGMLRSFDYAAQVALGEQGRPKGVEREVLQVHADAWAEGNRRLFWGAYLARAGHGPMLPATSREMLAMRRAFEVQKAVYEAEYELAHRPDWVGMPLRFLLAQVSP
jgi:maltokinase